MDITASIVTYNNPITMLDLAIKSFLNTKLDVKLYIIDNSPTNSLGRMLSYPQVEYFYMNSNKGFGAGHNYILRDHASKMGKYHLVLNPDVSFEKGTLESLYNYMEINQDVGNVIPKVIYPNGDLQYVCKLLPTPKDWIIRMFIPFHFLKQKINYNFEMQYADFNKEMNVPYLPGCFMFLRKSVIEDVGVFDEGIFMYGEDTDLNRRIYMKYRTMYYPEAIIVHKLEKGSHKSFHLLWIHIKAAIYYMNKWGWIFDGQRNLINKKIKRIYFKKR